MKPLPPVGPDMILPRLVARRALETPDAPFLIDVGGRELSYRQTHEETMRWAAAYHAHGVRQGDRVSVMVPTSTDSVLAWLGAAYLGAINVPLNTSYRGALLSHALTLTTPKVLVVDARLTESLGAVDSLAVPRVVVRRPPGEGLDQLGELEGLIGLEVEWLHDFLEVGARPEPPEANHQWSGISGLMFTSGTTGPSKAVVMPWRQLYESSVWVWQTQDAGSRDRNYIPWPTNHISGAGGVYGMAVVGGAAVLREKWSTSRFMDDVYDYGCTMTTLMGAMGEYVRHMELPAGRGDCPLERVFIAPVTATTAGLMAKLGAVYCTDYNSTELSGPIVSNHHDPVPVGSAGLRRPGVNLRIVDDRGDDLPTGAVGELLVNTDDPDAMNQGYWGMPEATQQAWAGGWFHTGDLLRRDEEGYFYFVGRLKDVIRVRGENVSAHEVEMVVNTIPGIVESAAVGEPAEDSEENIVLFAVMTADGPTDEQLLAECRERLPRFMIPHRIVRSADLPKTPTGKVRKDVLKSRIGQLVTATESEQRR